jgi:hypothetical protein
MKAAVIDGRVVFISQPPFLSALLLRTDGREKRG